MYNSNEYYDACKMEALKIIKYDPIFVLNGMMAKLVKCIQIQIEYISGNSPLTYYRHPYIFCMIGILINSILLIRKKRIRAYIKEYCNKFILCLGAVICSLYSGVLAYPSEYYILGGLGGLGILLVMLFYSMIGFNMETD